MLEWLEHENLFLFSMDSERLWFRYHSLFRELLRQRLHSGRSPQEIAELHKRAGGWLAGERRVDAALEHLLAAGEAAAACALVVREAGAAVDEERWHDLERWVRRLPSETVEAEPELLVAKAWILELRQAWGDLAPVLDLSEALLEQRPSSPERALLQSEIWALRAHSLYWQGDGPGTLAVASRVTDPSRPARPQARGLAQILVAGGLQLQGDIGAARGSFQRMMGSRGGDALPPRALAGLGLVELVAGDLTAVGDVADAIMAKALPLGLTDSVGWSHLFQGTVAYQRNVLDVAEEHFTAVVHRPLGVTVVPLKECFFGLALLHRARGELEKSAMTAEEAVGVLASTGNPALVSQARSLQVRLELLSGRQVAVASWLDAFGDLPDTFSLDVVYEYPPLTLAHALIADGREESYARADSILSRLGEAAERSANTFRCIQVRCLQVLLCNARGDTGAALEALAESVELARPGGFVRMHADVGSHMLPLLQRLLVGRRRDDYLRQTNRLVLLGTRRTRPDGRPVDRWLDGSLGCPGRLGSSRISADQPGTRRVGPARRAPEQQGDRPTSVHLTRYGQAPHFEHLRQTGCQRPPRVVDRGPEAGDPATALVGGPCSPPPTILVPSW